MDNKRDKYKSLYKKYSNLSNPELIRNAIEQELNSSFYNKQRRIIASYYANKRKLVKALSEIVKMIDIELEIRNFNKDFGWTSNNGKLYILQEESHRLSDLIIKLDMEYGWAKYLANKEN